MMRKAKSPARAFRFSRQTIIKACNLLRKIGHADIDHLLLDIGLNHIDAGRDKGGLTARAVALGAYVVEHADERSSHCPHGLVDVPTYLVPRQRER